MNKLLLLIVMTIVSFTTQATTQSDTRTSFTSGERTALIQVMDDYLYCFVYYSWTIESVEGPLEKLDHDKIELKLLNRALVGKIAVNISDSIDVSSDELMTRMKLIEADQIELADGEFLVLFNTYHDKCANLRTEEGFDENMKLRIKKYN